VPLHRPVGKSGVEVSWYFVAFIDVLGQGDQLRQLTGLPSRTPDDPLVETLRRTLGAVCQVRENFEIMFQARASDPKMLARLTPEQRTRFDQLNRESLISYGFSDSIVLAVSLTAEPGDPTPLNSIWSAVFASCGVALLALAAGYAVRGGVDIGVGALIGPQEIYGACLERAYTLESKVAGYPRIAVGEELLRYLQFVIEQPRTNDSDLLRAMRAESIARLIHKDADGRPALDFLGEEFRALGDEEGIRTTVKRAFDFVEAEIGRHEVAGATKIAARYRELRTYFASRLPTIWNLPVDP
jgi:hypothetical protein